MPQISRDFGRLAISGWAPHNDSCGNTRGESTGSTIATDNEGLNAALSGHSVARRCPDRLLGQCPDNPHTRANFPDRAVHSTLADLSVLMSNCRQVAGNRDGSARSPDHIALYQGSSRAIIPFQFMAYTLLDHRHRFSVWAAARAAQRGLKGGKVDVLRDTVEQSGVVEFARAKISVVDADAFNKEHRRWCSSIVEYLQSRDVSASFGRAAKLIAIYLKSMVILDGSVETERTRFIHPPIDGILLRNLCKASDLQSTHKATWKSLKWTGLTEREYYGLIEQLRMCTAKGEPFWTLEKYWTVTEDEA